MASINPPLNSAARNPYVPRVDTLRGIAALSIIYIHYFKSLSPDYLNITPDGVGFFFVISGYLITQSILSDRESFQPIDTIKRFYLRRVVRIMPAYYATVFVCAFIGLYGTSQSLPWALTFTTNFFVFRGIGDAGYFGHLWTLAVEEQFYLFLPFALLCLRRKTFVALSCAGIVASLLFRLHEFGISQFFPENTISQIDKLAMGCLAFLAVAKYGAGNVERWLRFTLPLGFSSFLFCSAMPLLSRDQLYDAFGVPTTLSGLFFSWLIVKAYADGPNGSAWGGSILPKVGQISYGVYLFHWPMMALARLIDPANSVWGYLVAVVATFLLATLSFRLFEKPLLDWGKGLLQAEAPTAVRDQGTNWVRVNNTAATNTQGKNVEIQLLRIVAVVLVILCHLQAVMYAKDDQSYSRIFAYIDPEIGVDIFFVISGYLLGKSFLSKSTYPDARHMLPTTWRFWRRRFLRLFPASFFWITFTLIVGLASRRPELWPSPRDLVHLWSASVFSLRNFANAASPSSLGYYWPLSAVNQFCLLLPIVWFLMPRPWFWRLVIGLIVVAALYRPGGENWRYLRFDGLLWGLGLYSCLKSEPLQSIVKGLHPPRRPVGVVALALVVLAMTGLLVSVGPSFAPLAYAADCMVAAVIVGLATLNRGFIPLPSTALGRKLVCLGGDLTYSLYLCHLPLWFLMRDVAGRLGFGFVGWQVMVPVGLLAAILVAFLSYRFIELPFITERSIEGDAMVPAKA